MQISLMPIGRLESTVLRHLAPLISTRFHVDVEVGNRVPVEIFVRDERRGQYLSTQILKALSGVGSSSEEPILGVADVDLFVPSLNFVFGEADPRTGVAVISVTRLRQSFYGLEEDERLFLERAGKEAVHELGHVFGLGHCVHPRCVMYFSNSLADTDLKEDRFCRKCAAILDVSLKS